MHREGQRWNSNPGQFFETVTFVPVIVFSFRITETIVTGSRTQDTFPEFLPFKSRSLVSGHMHTKFAANWWIRSRPISLRSHPQANNFNFVYKTLAECGYMRIQACTHTHTDTHAHIGGHVKPEENNPRISC
jgi:hypothetical protein